MKLIGYFVAITFLIGIVSGVGYYYVQNLERTAAKISNKINNKRAGAGNSNHPG